MRYRLTINTTETTMLTRTDLSLLPLLLQLVAKPLWLNSLVLELCSPGRCQVQLVVGQVEHGGYQWLCFIVNTIARLINGTDKALRMMKREGGLVMGVTGRLARHRLAARAIMVAGLLGILAGCGAGAAKNDTFDLSAAAIEAAGSAKSRQILVPDPTALKVLDSEQVLVRGLNGLAERAGGRHVGDADVAAARRAAHLNPVQPWCLIWATGTETPYVTGRQGI